MESKTGLLVKDPNFYFRHKDPLYLSKIDFGKNINKEIVLIGGPKSEATAYGIVKLKQSIKINSVDDIADRVPNSVFVSMKDSINQLYAFPVVRVKEFTEPRRIKSGMAHGQRHWVREVKYQRMLLEDYKNLSISELQSYHDRIHSFVSDKGQISEELFLAHYMVAEEFYTSGINHPLLNQIDYDYELLRSKAQLKENNAETVDEMFDELEKIYPDKKDTFLKTMVLNLREDFTDSKVNKLIDNIGQWTPDIVRKWVSQDLDDNEANVLAQRANDIFHVYIRRGASSAYAIQMAVAKSVAKIGEMA